MYVSTLANRSMCSRARHLHTYALVRYGHMPVAHLCPPHVGSSSGGTTARTRVRMTGHVRAARAHAYSRGVVHDLPARAARCPARVYKRLGFSGGRVASVWPNLTPDPPS